MSPEKEELLTDPVNHAVLKTMAAEGQISLEELSEKIGVREDRLKHRTKRLDSEELLERKANYLRFRDKHRQKIEDYRDSAENFSEKDDENISESLQEHREELEDIREELEREKEDTELVTKEKDVDEKLELVEKAINSDKDNLENLSQASRVRKLLDEDEINFHSFHPFRKHKAKKKAEEILGNSPQEKKERRFFGNRWISRDRLSN